MLHVIELSTCLNKAVVEISYCQVLDCVQNQCKIQWEDHKPLYFLSSYIFLPRKQHDIFHQATERGKRHDKLTYRLKASINSKTSNQIIHYANYKCCIQDYDDLVHQFC